MDVKELRAKSASELQDHLLTLRREQFNLRVQQATGQQAHPDQYSRVRREIARLKTILREQELTGQTVTQKVSEKVKPTAAKPKVKAAAKTKAGTKAKKV